MPTTLIRLSLISTGPSPHALLDSRLSAACASLRWLAGREHVLQLELPGDSRFSAPSTACGVANGAVRLLDPRILQTSDFTLAGILNSSAHPLRFSSACELGAILSAATDPTFAMLGEANRRYAQRCLVSAHEARGANPGPSPVPVHGRVCRWRAHLPAWVHVRTQGEQFSALPSAAVQAFAAARQSCGDTTAADLVAKSLFEAAAEKHTTRGRAFELDAATDI